MYNLLNLNRLIACIYVEVITNMHNNYMKYEEEIEGEMYDICTQNKHNELKAQELDKFVTEDMRRKAKMSGSTMLYFNKKFESKASLERMVNSILSESFILYDEYNGTLIITFTGIDRDTASGGNGKILNSVMSTIKEYDVKYSEYYLTFGTKARLINKNCKFNKTYQKLNAIESQDSVSSYNLNKRTTFTILTGVTHNFSIVLDVSNELYDDEMELDEIEDYEDKMDTDNRNMIASLRGLLHDEFQYFMFNNHELLFDLIKNKDKML